MLLLFRGQMLNEVIETGNNKTPKLPYCPLFVN